MDYRVDSKKRTIAKAIVWRLIGIIACMLIALHLTDDVSKSVDFTVWTQVISFVLYYFHERVWAHIKWGRY